MGGEEAISLDFACDVPGIVSALALQVFINGYSEIAHSRPNPSLVEVPLPSSSMTLSECSEAD